MKTGPKPKYCYVCRREPPCGPLAKCNRLKGEEKERAYREGYRAKHGTELRRQQAEIYRRTRPDAEPYRPRVV